GQGGGVDADAHGPQGPAGGLLQGVEHAPGQGQDDLPVAGGLARAARDQRVEQDGRLRSEEHTSELQSLTNLVCRLLLEKTKISSSPPTCRGRSSGANGSSQIVHSGENTCSVTIKASRGTAQYTTRRCIAT